MIPVVMLVTNAKAVNWLSIATTYFFECSCRRDAILTSIFSCDITVVLEFSYAPVFGVTVNVKT